MSPYETCKILREELEALLKGPGVTWNLKGVLNQYDKAVASTAFRIMQILTQKDEE